MNKLGLIGLVFLFFVGCGKMPINGKLDGRWQLMQVDYHSNGTQVRPAYTYYDFSLHLMQFRKTNGTDGTFGYINGRFQQTRDSLCLQMIRQNKSIARKFGLNDTIQCFSVETLTKKKMILNSDSARLEFRKF